MKNIGFVTYWGFPRGMSYMNLSYVKMIKDKHNVYIYKIGNNEINEEFKVPEVDVTENPSNTYHEKTFRQWVSKNKLDAVYFSEFDQWGKSSVNLPKIASSLGCKVYGINVMERYEDGQADTYDKMIAQTVSMERFYRKNKVRNFKYIPFSIDMDEFPNPDDNDLELEKSDKFTFFHPGGFGGVANRKNTQAVIDAFMKLNNEDTELIITSQKDIVPDDVEIPDNIEIIERELSRSEMIKKYYEADVTVLPSKWETIGLPILESLASGTPVITNDVPPMNEFVNTGKNGYLCSVDLKKYEGISVLGAEVDSSELKNKMKNSMNKTLYPVLCRNARHIVEEIYNLEKNKKYLIEFLEDELE